MKKGINKIMSVVSIILCITLLSSISTQVLAETIGKNSDETPSNPNFSNIGDGTEVGKGKYDSISSKDMKIVSSYGITLGVLPSKLIITDRNVLIATPRTISLAETNLFITHNPYSYQDVSSWHKIHNSGMYDISIGMYGNSYDRDRKSKIELLSKLVDKMDTDTELTQDTLGDKYFCSLNSRRYIKRKILTR